MEPNGPENSEGTKELQERKEVDVEVRFPVFSYVSEGLSRVYKRELDALRQDGSFDNLREFHRGPFSLLMSQILDTATAQGQNESSKVTLGLTDEEMKVIKAKVEAPLDAAGRLLHTQMMDELKDNYRSAKFTKNAKDLVNRMKSSFKKK